MLQISDGWLPPAGSCPSNKEDRETSPAADTRTTSSRFFPASGLSVRTALVYDGELASSVVRRGWFDFLVPADTLLAP